MILYLTGLNNISSEQVEAARMDNAKGWSMLWHIIIPQLRPATFIALVVTVIGALRSFDLISIMTVGGPYGSTRVLSYFMYEQALSEYGICHGLWRRNCSCAVRHHAGVHFNLHCAHARPRKEQLMFPTPIARTKPWVQIAYKLLLPVALILWLLPLIGIAVTSIRPSSDLAAGNYFGMPSGFDFVKNYSAVFENSNIGWYILNSFKVTIPTVIGAVGLSCLTGFALAVYKFKSNLLVFFMFVAGNFVPFQILAIPVRDLTQGMGLYNTTTGLVLFHVAFQTGFCTLFMRNFIKGLPFALIESARVEGVNEWKIFWHIVMPLMRPAIAALSVLIFTFIWNDYFWATVMANSAEVRPVTAGMSELKGQWKVAWELISAASIIAALPPVAMFFLMQKHFIAGLTLGATKG